MGNEDERPSIWISADTKKKYIKDERCIIDVDSVLGGRKFQLGRQIT